MVRGSDGGPARLRAAPAGAATPRARRHRDHLGRQEPGHGSPRAAAVSATAFRPAEYRRQSRARPPALTGSVATSWPTRNKGVASTSEGAEAGQPELADAVWYG